MPPDEIDRSCPLVAEEPPAGKIIAGPCSAETREQVLSSARRLRDLGISYFRAALWKPRTRPGTFEGVGLQGLPWLQEVRDTLGMKVGTELCHPGYARTLLDAGMDFIWLGARTVSNPYMVDAIAEAIEGADLTVLVKNPISPDTELWMGAIERLHRRNIPRIVAVLRGCTPIRHTRLRNYPYWSMIAEIKDLYRKTYGESRALPVLLDPSHIAGQSDLVGAVCMTGLCYPIDGFMIESHPAPAQALSDAAQQLTPDELAGLMQRLHAPNTTPQDALIPLRYQIRDIDDTILELLAHRLQLARTIGLYKAAHDLSPYQEQEHSASTRRYIELARLNGIDDRLATQLYELIHRHSVCLQQEIAQMPERG